MPLSVFQMLLRPAMLLTALALQPGIAFSQTDTTPATATILAPVPTSTITPDGTYTIHGEIVDDISGVQKLWVLTQRTDTKPWQYWNGTEWSTAKTGWWRRATLGTDNTWSLDNVDFSDFGDYRIQLYSIDNASNRAKTAANPIVTFSVRSDQPDTKAPIATVTAPLADSDIDPTDSYTLTGTVVDDISGVKRFWARVERTDTSPKQYWNGSSWSTAARGGYRRAALSDDDTWSVSNVDLSNPGDYLIRLISLDFANNRARANTNPQTSFSVKSPEPDNLPPLAVADTATLVAGSDTLINVLDNDTDEDDNIDAGSVVITRNPRNGDAEVQTDGTVTYDHDGSTTTEDSFSYQVSDDLGLPSNIVDVDITVEPIEPPHAADDAVTIARNESIVISALDNDTTNSVLDVSSILVVNGPSDAKTFVVRSDGTILYEHDGSKNPTDTIVYKVANTNGMQSNEGTITITIEGNDPPVAADDTLELTVNTGAVVNVVANDTDPDNNLDINSVKFIDLPSNGTVELQADGDVLYTNENVDGDDLEDSFTYQVFDDKNAASNVATVHITLAQRVNLAPAVVDDAVTITAYDAVDIAVLANDEDTDGSLDVASLSIVDEPAEGTYTIVDGVVNYVHLGGVALTDSFTYTIADNEGLTSDTATVTITVDPLPSEAPVAADDASTVARGLIAAIDVLDNDTDRNQDLNRSSVEIITGPANGEITIRPDGVVEYDHDGGLTLTDSFSYRVFDADLNSSNTAVVTVTIEPAEAPIAADDTVTVSKGKSQLISVLTNDTANTSIDISSILILENPLHAETFQVNSDGTILYKHNGDASQTDTFKYKVFNVQGMFSNDAVVDITISPNLMTISDLSYQGAFTLPGNTYGESSMNYAQGPLEVNGNAMYIVGHTHQDAIAKFNVPALVNSHNIADLNSTGSPVQNFSKIIDRAATGNPDNLDKVVGLEVVDDSLVVNLISYYDGPGDNTLTTLVVNDADALATSEISAMHHMVGDSRAAGWISSVPAEWQDTLSASHISGNSSGDPIISRLSVGPSAFAVNLTDNLQSTESLTIPATELQGYSLDNRLHDDLLNSTLSNTLWTHLSQARYGFIVPGTNTYMTLGISGGHTTGVGYKNTLENGSECPGYCPNASTDSYNYFWLWNMQDWLAVQAGELQPHEISPYEHGQLDMPFQTAEYINEIGGASYDEVTGLLYITILEANIDGYDNPPVVVAYKINQ